MTPTRRKTLQARNALATLASEPARAARPTIYQSNHGSCDCCGKTRPLTFVIYVGMDTWTCDACRGVDTEDDSDVDAFLEGL